MASYFNQKKVSYESHIGDEMLRNISPVCDVAMLLCLYVILTHFGALMWFLWALYTSWYTKKCDILVHFGTKVVPETHHFMFWNQILQHNVVRVITHDIWHDIVCYWTPKTTHNRCNEHTFYAPNVTFTVQWNTQKGSYFWNNCKVQKKWVKI